MKKVLLVGNSHTTCIAEALEKLSSEISLRYIYINALDAESIKNGADYNLALINEIKKQVFELAGLPYDDVADIHSIVKSNNINTLMLIGGNAHNIVGLVKMERTWDFYLKGCEYLGVNESDEILPYEAVRLAIKSRMKGYIGRINLIKKLLKHNVFHLDAPPPIGDDGHILKNIDRYFRETYKGNIEIVNPLLRYKLWRVSSTNYLEACMSSEVKFLPVPNEAMVDEMFLKKEFYTINNATHANSLYGTIIVNNFIDILN